MRDKMGTMSSRESGKNLIYRNTELSFLPTDWTPLYATRDGRLSSLPFDCMSMRQYLLTGDKE